MVPFKPTFPKQGDSLPQISWLQKSHPADRVLFTLPDDAKVAVPLPPAGVESEGNWGEIRRQLGLVYSSNDQLPEIRIGMRQEWLCTYP